MPQIYNWPRAWVVHPKISQLSREWINLGPPSHSANSKSARPASRYNRIHNLFLMWKISELWSYPSGNFKRLSLSDVNHSLPDLATLKAENVKVETRPPGSGDVSDFTLIPRFRSKIPTVRDYLEIHLILHAASVVLTYLQWNTLTSDELCPIENRISLSAILYISPCWEGRGDGDNAWMMEDGGRGWSLVPAGGFSHLPAWGGGSKQTSSRQPTAHRTVTSRQWNGNGFGLEAASPSLDGPECWPNQKRPALFPTISWRGVYATLVQERRLSSPLFTKSITRPPGTAKRAGATVRPFPLVYQRFNGRNMQIATD